MRQPKVGIVLAFTGLYESVQVLGRFLGYVGFEVVASRVSTAPVVDSGTALASADFCFPLRVYVGHVHTLIRQHPDLDVLVAPNVWTDHEGTCTCAKYRDIGGVAIRSLGGMLPYLRSLEGATGPGLPLRLPRVLRPNIESPSFGHLQGVAIQLYRQILGLPLTAPVTTARAAFTQAWDEVQGAVDSRRSPVLAGDRPRLALVGRRYLIDDPLLCADLAPWFRRRGVTVLTAWDLPRSALHPYYARVKGFYDTHREGEAFIDWAADKVDGFIVLGSFGCHPDGFQVDYLAEHARTKGKPAWTFRFDETTGTAGFQTRFETIHHFLQGQRDRRVAATSAPAAVTSTPVAAPSPAASPAPPSRPIFVWPYMGEELSLIIQELFVQLGLDPFMHPPRAIDGATLELGNRRYAETCSPYACATGSLMESIRQVTADLHAEASRTGRPVEPRRIIVLMVQGEGPCTFGWYALAHKHHLAADLAAELADGHTVELITIENSDPIGLFQQLGQLSNNGAMEPLIRYMQARSTGRLDQMSAPARLCLTAGLLRALYRMIGPAWAKMVALEQVRARSLLVRAHEQEPGSTTRAYRECLAELDRAHSRRAIRHSRRRCIARLNQLPQDRTDRPRVAAVGEIYGALTSYANRGVIEKLIGRERIEVVEGVTLRGFIQRALWEIGRQALAEHPWIRPCRRWLEARGIHLLAGRPQNLRARPLMEWEVGGEGLPGVAFARVQVERGVDGILHVYPFKCMPEAIAKDAYKELSDLYGVRYLGLSFDKEQEIERVKTEVATFAALLRSQAAERRSPFARLITRFRRRSLGRMLNRVYRRAERPRGRTLAQ